MGNKQEICRIFSFLFIFLMLLALQNGHAEPDSDRFLFFVAPGFGIAGSSVNTNTLIAAGRKNKNAAWVLAYRYSYAERTTGSFWNKIMLDKYWDRGVLFMRAFYPSKAVVLVGAGISGFHEEFFSYRPTQHSQPRRTFNFPLEMRIFTGKSNTFGIGLTFFLALNRNYFHAGGGFQIAIGKFK